MLDRTRRAGDRLSCWLPWPRRPHTCFFSLRPSEGGPGTFARKLSRAFGAQGVQTEYRRLHSAQAALIFSVSWGDWFHRLCRRWGIRTVLRVDGFYVPAYFDNREQPPDYQDRRLTLGAMRINHRLQRDLLLSDFVIYQSEFSKHMADRFLYNRRRDFAIIQNGVDLEAFSPGPARSGRRRLLVAGVLRDEYMLGTALPVFERLWRRYDLELLVVGSLTAICRQQLRDFAARHPLAFERVQVIGSVDNDEMPHWMRQADILIHPRLGDWCPNTVVEAMACGLPVVCGSWGGAAELVGDGGIVVATDQWSYGNAYISDLEWAVAQILDRHEMHSHAARTRAEATLDISQVSLRYLEYLGFEAADHGA